MGEWGTYRSWFNEKGERMPRTFESGNGLRPPLLRKLSEVARNHDIDRIAMSLFFSSSLRNNELGIRPEVPLSHSAVLSLERGTMKLGDTKTAHPPLPPEALLTRGVIDWGKQHDRQGIPKIRGSILFQIEYLFELSELILRPKGKVIFSDDRNVPPVHEPYAQGELDSFQRWLDDYNGAKQKSPIGRPIMEAHYHAQRKLPEHLRLTPDELGKFYGYTIRDLICSLAR